MKTTPIRLKKDLVDRLADIKETNGLKSYNEVLELVLPLGIKVDHKTYKMPPAFTLKGDIFGKEGENTCGFYKVSWDELKNSKQGDSFSPGSRYCEVETEYESAKVLYIDDKRVIIEKTTEGLYIEDHDVVPYEFSEIITYEFFQK